jgi:predicted TPR repeat methyltransferase
METNMDFDSIDWAALWQAESGHSNVQNNASAKALWEKRALHYDKTVNRVKEGQPRDKDDYISKMLDRIEVQPDWTVLDIGCGPGTLAIPLAQKAQSVTALDISSEMLKRLKDNAEKKGVDNIRYVNADWEEAFNAGQPGHHDVVVASRSLMSGDMHKALSYIVSIADKAAYLTFPVVHLPLDMAVYRAIGRGHKKHPPYIYLVNRLYQMGVNANVEILFSKVKVQFPGIDEAVADLQWRTDTFTPEEKAKVQQYLKQNLVWDKATSSFTHEGKSQWALIWWRQENRMEK